MGAAGILIPVTRRAAGIGLFLLTIAVTPANVYMLQHAELFNVPRWALIVRLPFQVVLLALILWSTSTNRPPAVRRQFSPPYLTIACMPRAPKLTGLSGNEIYCMRLKGLIPSGVVIGNSIQSMGFSAVSAPRFAASSAARFPT